MSDMEDLIAYTKNMARDMQILRASVIEITNYMKEAESEVPEKMRRFVMYMHDAHESAIFHERGGQPMPSYLVKELERCDDRYRQLLEELHTSGAAFDKVREEMTKDPKNRWDHNKLLTKESK